jgi:hypothetical protein
MGLHALFLNGQFGNGTNRVGFDILAEILSNFHLIEMLLRHCHCLFYIEVSCHLTIVSFPRKLHFLS